MLETVIRPDRKKVDFTYDALGRRLSKTYKGTTTHFVWDGNTLLHEWQNPEEATNTEVNDSGEIKIKEIENLTTWVFEDGTFIPSAKLQGNKKYSIITDYLGTPVQAYDEYGSLSWERELDIYGEVRKGDSDFIPFLYQGQYYDAEVEMAYNWFRYYSPESGGYISQDPIGLNGGIPNFYAYVRDINNWVDVLGLISVGTNTALTDVLARGIHVNVKDIPGSKDIHVGIRPTHNGGVTFVPADHRAKKIMKNDQYLWRRITNSVSSSLDDTKFLNKLINTTNSAKSEFTHKGAEFAHLERNLKKMLPCS